MGTTNYNLGQVELMEAKAEAELGRADEPLGSEVVGPDGRVWPAGTVLTPDSYGSGIFPGLRPWEYPLPELYIHGLDPRYQAYLTPSVESNEVQLILTPWVEEGPDYLAITRDVVGG